MSLNHFAFDLPAVSCAAQPISPGRGCRRTHTGLSRVSAIGTFNPNLPASLTQLPLEFRKRLLRKGFFNRFLLRFVVHSINFDVQNPVALLDREPNEISSFDIDGFIADT